MIIDQPPGSQIFGLDWTNSANHQIKKSYRNCTWPTYKCSVDTTDGSPLLTTTAIQTFNDAKIQTIYVKCHTDSRPRNLFESVKKHKQWY